MAIIMDKNGSVRPFQMSDLTEVAQRDERIRQLERLNATLAAEIDRMRPVAEAAVEWRRVGYERKDEFAYRIGPLLDAIDIYATGAKRPCEEM